METFALIEALGVSIREIDELGRWSRYVPSVRMLFVERTLDAYQRERLARDALVAFEHVFGRRRQSSAWTSDGWEKIRHDDRQRAMLRLRLACAPPSRPG